MKTNKFWQEFDVVQATSSALLSKAYSLRYQCYCIENKFEPENMLEMESDNYDLFSVHGLLYNDKNKIYFGNVRLIKPTHKPFPIETFVDIKQHVVKECSLEISRFCLSKELKKQLNKKSYEPFYMLALIKWLIQYSLFNNYKYLLAIMEPALIHLLKKYSINFEIIGKEIEYHGIRYPCYISVDNVIEIVQKNNRKIFEFMFE